MKINKKATCIVFALIAILIYFIVDGLYFIKGVRTIRVSSEVNIQKRISDVMRRNNFTLHESEESWKKGDTVLSFKIEPLMDENKYVVVEVIYRASNINKIEGAIDEVKNQIEE